MNQTNVMLWINVWIKVFDNLNEYFSSYIKGCNEWWHEKTNNVFIVLSKCVHVNTSEQQHKFTTLNIQFENVAASRIWLKCVTGFVCIVASRVFHFCKCVLMRG